MKNNAGVWILFFVLFIFIKHVVLNPKYLPLLGYGIGAIGMIGAALLVVYVMFRPLIK